jgi:hypothetical protein
VVVDIVVVLGVVVDVVVVLGVVVVDVVDVVDVVEVVDVVDVVEVLVDVDVDVEDVADVVVVSSAIRRDVKDESRFNLPRARPIDPKIILALVFFEKSFHLVGFLLPSFKTK